jgi:hypothetical protein
LKKPEHGDSDNYPEDIRPAEKGIQPKEDIAAQTDIEKIPPSDAQKKR